MIGLNNNSPWTVKPISDSLGKMDTNWISHKDFDPKHTSKIDKNRITVGIWNGSDLNTFKNVKLYSL